MLRIFVIAGDHALSQPMPCSMAWRARYRSEAWGWEFVRWAQAGMMVLMPCCASHARRVATTCITGNRVSGPRQPRADPIFHQGPGLGAIVAMATYRVQTQEMILLIWILVWKPTRLRSRAGSASRSDENSRR